MMLTNFCAWARNCSRTDWGWLATLFYLAIIIGAFARWYPHRDPTTDVMGPNGWGDFLAGAAAPLAFLWLVLGYLQQGEELAKSSRALIDQAETMRKELVYQRETAPSHAPKFIHAGTKTNYNVESRREVVIENAGAQARHLRVIRQPNGVAVRITPVAIVQPGETAELRFSCEPSHRLPNRIEFALLYEDAVGRYFSADCFWEPRRGFAVKWVKQEKWSPDPSDLL